MSNIDRLLEMPASEYQVVDVIALRDAFHDKVEAIVTLRKELEGMRSEEADRDVAFIAQISETAKLRAELDALRKQEPVAWRPGVDNRASYSHGIPSQRDHDYWKEIGVELELAYSAPVPPAAVAEVPVDDVIEKIVEYGGHRENEGGSYATFQKSEARRYRAEADDVLAEVRALLSATPAPVAPKVPMDELCEALIEASDMRWNGDVYVGDGADLMNLVRTAMLAAAQAQGEK